MNNTPTANRTHIAIYGKTNSGKSSLLNAIIGQDIAIVSPTKGTTTDPVSKAMELIPYGPVIFIDTAGLDDDGELGNLRINKTIKTMDKTDFAIYVMDINDTETELFSNTITLFNERNIPYILVISKSDLGSNEKTNNIRKQFPSATFVSVYDYESIINLKQELINKLESNIKEETLIGDLVPYNGTVVLVVPIDSEAPKGRLILPQVQIIRDCLDHGIKCYVVRDTELKSGLIDIKNIDLVVTDSQAFKEVDKIVPQNIKLTGFSILFARHKGDLSEFLDGVSKVNSLNENSKILIMESCTHNTSHEDIGRVKIPKLLNNHVGKNLDYIFKMGQDFPDDIDKYDLIIHCGSCMLNKKTMERRINICKQEGVSITNYGILLAYLNGILDRAIEVF